LLADVERLTFFEKVRNNFDITPQELRKIQARLGVSLWLCDLQLEGCEHDKTRLNQLYAQVAPEKTNHAFARGFYVLYLRSFEPCTLDQLHYQLSTLDMDEEEMSFCSVLVSSIPRLGVDAVAGALALVAQCPSIDQWVMLLRCCQSLVVNGCEEAFANMPLLLTLLKAVPCAEGARLLCRLREPAPEALPLPPPTSLELYLAGQPTDDDHHRVVLGPAISTAAGQSTEDALVALTSLRQIHLTWNRSGALLSACCDALASLSAFRHGNALAWCELLSHPALQGSPLDLTLKSLYAGSFAVTDVPYVNDCVRHMHANAWDAALTCISRLPESRETAALHLDLLIHAGRPVEALEIAALATIRYPTLVPRFPLSEISEIARNVQPETFNECLVLCVIFELCVRQLSAGFSRYRNESLEDALELSHSEKPSEWLSHITESDSPVVRELLPFVLQAVCVPSVIDTVPVCGSSRELLEERIQILQGLLESDCDDHSRLREEIVLLSSGLAVAQELQILDQHRIYVDVEGLTNQLAESLRPDFELYKRMTMISSEIDMQRRAQLLSGLDLDALRTLARIRANSALKSMRERVKSEFLLNRDYGLDGYLSGSIRHGSLESLLREPLSTTGLLGTFRGDTFHPPASYSTIVQSADEYVRHQCLQAYKQLAEVFQTYIDGLNRSWARVDVDGANPNAIFCFGEVVLSPANLEKMMTVEEFIDSCLDGWWERVRQSLAEARSFVRTEISAKLHEIARDFHGKMVSLNNDLVRTFTDNILGVVHERIVIAIEKLCEWLRLSELQEGTGHFEPEFAVQVAKTAIERLHRGLKFKWVETFRIPRIYLPRRCLKPWVDVWILLFSNVIRHSGQINRCLIEINFAYTESLGFSLSVTNPVVDGTASKHVCNAKSLIESGNYGDAVAKEGQTGLMKVLKTARVDLRAYSSSIIISEEPDSNFRVAVTVNPVELSKQEGNE
jgi:hypothetical protein